MQTLKEKFKRSLKYYYLKFVRIKARPKEIASGMALGLFIGMSPTMGFQIPLAFFTATLLGENKMAAVLGVWITNPFTAPIIYPINYGIGTHFVGHFLPVASVATVNFNNLAQMGFNLVVNLVAGGIITGILAAMVGYFVTLWLVIVYREKKAIKAHRPIILDLNDQIGDISSNHHHKGVTHH